MRDEEGALGRAVVGVDGGLVVEDVLVDAEVVTVDGPVERDQDHLRNLYTTKTAKCPVSQSR